MDGDVGAAVEDGGLDLFHECALAAELPDRYVEAAVGRRVDHHQLHRVGAGGQQPLGHALGLPPGQRAAPRGDADHGRGGGLAAGVTGRTGR
jgi:hypothetical protein